MLAKNQILKKSSEIITKNQNLKKVARNFD